MKQSLSYKIYVPLLLATIALSFSAYAFAQETNDTNSASTDRAERRVTLKVEFQNRMVNLSQNVIKRLTFGADRLANIAFRIETRVVKLKTLGIETSEIERKLLEAKGSLQTTRDIIAGFGSVQEAMGSDDPRTAFETIRAQFDDARASLKKTHALLFETVGLLRKLPVSDTNSPNTPVGNIESAQ